MLKDLVGSAQFICELVVGRAMVISSFCTMKLHVHTCSMYLSRLTWVMDNYQFRMAWNVHLTLSLFVLKAMLPEIGLY